MTPLRLMRNTFPPSRSSRISNASTTSIPAIAVSSLHLAPTNQPPSRHPHIDPPNLHNANPPNHPLRFHSHPSRRREHDPEPPPTTRRPDHRAPDARTLQLGATVRALHARLPTLLKEPLPAELLSPQISLHLFPSTHPHLPTVSGRIAYVAALWTAPVAWGRVPLVGNVQLIILSERMVRHGGGNGGGHEATTRDEKLIVKWKTCGKTTHRDGTGGIYRGMGIAAKDPVDRIKEFIAGAARGGGGGGGAERSTAASPSPASDAGMEPEEFCGIFVFEFDEQGRIVKHVIEHTDEGGRWDKMTRVVSVTDWLLGRFNGKNKHEDDPALALCQGKSIYDRIDLANRS